MVAPRAGEPKTLMYALEAEHCKKSDSRKDFTSANGLTTTSAIEWEIVASPKEEREYPERDGFKVKHPEWWP